MEKLVDLEKALNILKELMDIYSVTRIDNKEMCKILRLFTDLLTKCLEDTLVDDINKTSITTTTPSCEELVKITKEVIRMKRVWIAKDYTEALNESYKLPREEREEFLKNIDVEQLPCKYRADIEEALKEEALKGESYKLFEYKFEPHYIRELREQGFMVREYDYQTMVEWPMFR